MKTGDICRYLDQVVPLSLQESYDNSGLQTGCYDDEAGAALLTIDVNEEVIAEAIGSGCNIVISHHPLIFAPLKRISDHDSTQRTLMAAIRNNITVYSVHTNLDSLYGGVSFRMAEKLGMVNVEVLSPASGKLVKLVTFIPEGHLDRVREAIFAAGAGHVGNYDHCGYHTTGEGSFRGNEKTNPFAGRAGEVHHEPEARFETILPAYLVSPVVRALIDAHPYEEPAFDLYPLSNHWERAGMGCKGEFREPLPEDQFLELCKTVFSPVCLRHTTLIGKPVKKVALCGGAGAYLLDDAIRAGADAFVTGDVKYHQFAGAEKRILFVDAGHYETEKYSMHIIYDLLIKKFPNFALRFSETRTNPINCY
ncbi:MAG: Nif3-like dinuclear metal center hexameric protein [Bacteroidales bacterium]|nr:Nif3-like dinuclear metal center hexameric protein [Bacteroidales bacterium]